MAGTEQKVTKKRDPDEAPAIVLIDATLAALAAGVDRSEIMSALRFARGASGYKAPVWRAAAQSMTTAAEAQNGKTLEQSDVELRGPDA
jgi:hypothetical protein